MFVDWIPFIVTQIFLSLPIFLVLATGLLLMSIRAPQGPLRNLAILALLVLLGTQVLYVIPTLAELLLIQRGYSPHDLGLIFNGIRFVVHMLHALGYGFVIWILLRALKRPQ